MNQTMALPEAFVSRMKRLMGPEAESFLHSLTQSRQQGLRVNLLKAPLQEAAEKLPFALTPVPWCKEGFYYGGVDRPGLHPYHSAGVYYIQEPSAMAVVEALDIRPGERVLDLAAAPGGKATHAAVKLGGRGLLVANEIQPSRAKVLSENVERMGIPNCLVTQESPQRLAKRFPRFFDKVIVDAPCSGEGMFRKDPAIIAEWSVEHVARCQMRQKGILAEAARLVRPGGQLVYSTCTFAPEENEMQVASFLQSHPDFRLLPLPHAQHLDPGRPEWGGEEQLRLAGRIWPHRHPGEGHFLALMERSQEADGEEYRPFHRPAGRSDTARKLWKALQEFAAEYLKVPMEQWGAPEQLLLYGEQVYLLPEPMDLSHIRVLRPGLHLGRWRKERLEPAHAWAMSLAPEQVRQVLDLPSDSPEVKHYLRGNPLPVSPHWSGWVLVCTDGFSLGWGKAVRGTLKNHYPKGLRLPAR